MFGKIGKIMFIMFSAVLIFYNLSLPTDVNDQIREYESAIGEADNTSDIVFRVEISVNTNIGEIADILSKYGYSVSSVTAQPGTAKYEEQAEKRNDEVVSFIDDTSVKNNLKNKMTSGDIEKLKSVKDKMTEDRSSLSDTNSGLSSLIDILKGAVANLPGLIEQFFSGGLGDVSISDLQKLYEKSTDTLGKIVELPGKIMRIIGIIDKLLKFIFFFI